MEKLDILREKLAKSVNELQQICNQDRDMDSQDLLVRFTDSYKVLSGQVFEHDELSRIMQFDRKAIESQKSVEEEIPPIDSEIITEPE